MNEHTKTPWTVGHAGFERIPVVVSRRAGRPATVVICNSGDRDEDEANAAFIVRAVNSHDTLMDAIRIILANTEQDAIRHMGHDGMDAYEALAKAVADTCRAAIARTGEAK